MRVIAYIPSVPGVQQIRDSVIAASTAGGDEVTTIATTADGARDALDSGRGEAIVGRGADLLVLCQEAPDLLPRVRSVRPTPKTRAVAILALPALAWEKVRRHPRAATAVAVGAAGIAMAAALMTGLNEPMPGALPPPSPTVSRPSPSAAPRSPTLPPPSSPARPTSAPARSAPEPSQPAEPEGGAGGGPATVRPPSPSSPRQSRPPKPPPPATSAPATSAPPVAQPRDQRCIVDLDILGLPIKVCLP